MDYSSEKELFNDLKGALKVKLRMIKEKYDTDSYADGIRDFQHGKPAPFPACREGESRQRRI